MSESVFADIKGRSFPYTYHGTIEVGTLVGGIPSDPNVAKGWLETKLKGVTSEEQIQRMVVEVMAERKVTADEALDIVNKMKNLNGFKRGRDDGVLYYEARQLKAALREAVGVAVGSDKIKQQGWGNTRKWISGFFPEHVFIQEEKLYLHNANGVPFTEPTDILQQFVHTRFGSSIQYQEYVENAQFDFTVVTDYLFDDKDWGMIWTTGEMNGLGASRSQGYGTYKVIKWDKDFDKSAVRKSNAQLLADDGIRVAEAVPAVRTRGKGKAA